MTCEFNFPTTALENLQQQYRDNAKSCLEGEKATIQNMIDSIDTVLASEIDPRLEESLGLLETQKALLTEILSTIDERIELVDSINLTSEE